jgi:hypothetical protein
LPRAPLSPNRSRAGRFRPQARDLSCEPTRSRFGSELHEGWSRRGWSTVRSRCRPCSGLRSRSRRPPLPHLWVRLLASRRRRSSGWFFASQRSGSFPILSPARPARRE